MAKIEQVVTETLAEAVEHHTGSNPYLCYQCVRCSSGCPVAEHMDLLPHQVMRAIQFNDEEVFKANTPWICAACVTCSTRCPQGIDVAGVMDVLRMETRKRGLEPPIRDVELFTQVFLRGIGAMGRLYEAGLMGAMNMLTLHPLKDVPDLGVPMILKHKIRLFPEFVRPPKNVQPIQVEKNMIGYYPGCSLESTATEFAHSFEAVCEALGLKLVEPHGWICCGSTPAHTTDAVLAGYYAVQNLSVIERMGLDQMVAPCLGCYQRFKAAEYELRRDPELAEKVAEKIGYEYQGTVETLHSVEALLQRAGLEAITALVKKPLQGMRVASYYGCATTRPPRYTGADNVEYPMDMDDIVRALGGEPIDWSYKTDCCGGSLGITQTDVALELSAKILQNAHACGADLMVTACPLCQVNVEGRQVQMDLGFELPVLYLTQLMVLAFGLDEKKAELNKQMIDPRPVLQAHGLL
ncbi:MAG: 4Fe-4S dicluster domain-containing protein [Anaerolineae bacterium]|nr:4Fe-4S dicluster domain-containing protein [Anaerolineae bacterium]